ncbi:MAG: hypothetical protein R3D59_13920 [Paracoccaceae bacterium]
MPATTQDRWFARAWLAFPVVGLLALFWTVSGLVGFGGSRRPWKCSPARELRWRRWQWGSGRSSICGLGL